MEYASLGTAALMVSSFAWGADATWLAHEFTNDWDSTDNGNEAFLNRECRPSGLDGLQTFAVQKGHDSEFHVHVYCRNDHAESVSYRVSMAAVDRTNLEAVAQSWAFKPGSRVAAFHFGRQGESDGLLIIEAR